MLQLQNMFWTELGISPITKLQEYAERKLDIYGKTLNLKGISNNIIEECKQACARIKECKECNNGEVISNQKICKWEIEKEFRYVLHCEQLIIDEICNGECLVKIIRNVVENQNKENMSIVFNIFTGMDMCYRCFVDYLIRCNDLKNKFGENYNVNVIVSPFIRYCDNELIYRPSNTCTSPEQYQNKWNSGMLFSMFDMSKQNLQCHPTGSNCIQQNAVRAYIDTTKTSSKGNKKSKRKNRNQNPFIYSPP